MRRSSPSVSKTYETARNRARLQVLDKAIEVLTPSGVSRYEKYKEDFVTFGERELREQYTLQVKELMAAVAKYPNVIARSANAVGKSHSAARIAVGFYKSHEDVQVYITAAPPEKNIRTILWGQIMDIVQHHPKMFADDEITDLTIRRKSDVQSYITCLTIPTTGTSATRVAKFSGRHAPNIMFIVDEGDGVPEEVYVGIDSCLSGGNCKLLIMFNPREARGRTYRMERDHQAKVIHLSAFAHPNVITGKNVLPGAVTRDVTVQRINSWTKYVGPSREGKKLDPGCFVIPKYLVGTTAPRVDGSGEYTPLRAGVYHIEVPDFAYKTLGVYPPQSPRQLISIDWINAARSRWDAYVAKYGEVPPQHTGAIAGVDVGEFGGDKSVICFRYGGWVDRLIAWSNTDAKVTADRVGLEAKNRNIVIANVDAIGVGSAVAPLLIDKGIPANAIKSSETALEECELGKFYRKRDELWWNTREWFRKDSGAMIPPDEELIEELMIPTYHIDKNNGRVTVSDTDEIRETIHRSPDKAMALVMTFGRKKGYFDGCVFH